jgi:UDP-N-acetylmuramate--alanine ligase
MLDAVDFSGRPFHFIGIGGIGMSALAQVLTQKMLPVSGSDLASSNITQRLEAQGAQIFLTQGASNITQVAQGVLPQVVCSTAINPENSEYRAAVELGCPIFHRSDLLAALMKRYQGIAIAGTHGKTTTSSMVGYLLLKAGLDPTIVIGGEVNAWEGNAHVGQGVHFVAEADESDGSLVKHSAQIGVITNIELDHPDHYTTLEQVIDTFQIFASQCQQVIGCIDSPAVKEFIQPAITYSLWQSTADYTVDQVAYSADGTSALIMERGQVLGRLTLPILGEHNLSNALAAIAIGRLVGLEFSLIASILATFEGARRRFEHRGEYNHILFIDDYGHHPSEIQVTLAAARLRAESTTDPRRVVAVFQPHRYSRTLTFLSEFAESFGNADVVITTDIYSAGEPDLGQVTGQQLADAIATHHPHSTYQPSLQTVSAYLMETLLPGDLVLFLGAGNLNRVIPELTAFYQKIEQKQSIPSFR